MQNQGELAVAAANDNSILNIIAQAVSDPKVDVQKMRELFELQKDFMKEKARADYAAAMSACQAELQPIFKERENKDNKSKFARLDDVDVIARPVYTKHGFSLSFSSTETPEGFITMTCVATHRSGHERIHTKSGWRDDQGMKGGATKTRIQGSGSTGSYLKRYLTCDVFNIVTTDMAQQDNDGVSAAGPKRVTETQRQALVDALGGPGERVSAFCKHHGLEEIGQLGAASFDVAMAQIKAVNSKIQAAA